MSAAVETWGGRRILFVKATEQEYRSALRERIRPLIVGVGPVEAGVFTAKALAALEGEGALPDLLVSLGSAGSKRLEQGRVYQVSEVAYRDMDASAFGFDKGVTPFLDLPAVVALRCRVPDVPEATISTGADVVSGKAYDAIPQDMVDMESWAVLRASQAFGVPFVGLRGISDGATPVSKYEHWSDYLDDVDRGLAEALDKLREAIEVGKLGEWRT